jgi:FtsP/CotA-like multicopper oxidase with cupredoxin domain
VDGTTRTAPPTTRRSRLALLLAVPAGAALVAAAMAAGQAKSAATVTNSELQCATNSDGTTSTFALTAHRGMITTPDGNRVPMWGYSLDDSPYQYPSPFLCVNEGEKVNIVLHNQLGNGQSTSITFPGMTGVMANGNVVEPEVAGGKVLSLTNSVADGKTITYSFTASKPGSYLYVSGTDQAMQQQMGLFGGIVVRSATPGQAYDGAKPDSSYDVNHEYVQMLSDVDPDLHRYIDTTSVDNVLNYDWAKFRPRYWFINGRSMPDTIAPNNASWLPNQPYSGFVHVVADSAKPALIRYFNASELTHPFHPHGADTDVLGIDAHPLLDSNGDDMSIRKYLVEIAPGQTVDATWTWKSDQIVSNTSGSKPNQPWSPAAAANNGIPLPDFRDVRYTGENVWYGGSPYLGKKAPLPQDTTSFNECGEYYMVAHSHALNEATTYGTAMGGMLTLYRIDPPGTLANPDPNGFTGCNP